MRDLILVLPLPPSVNNLYATVNGRRRLSVAGQEFKQHAGWLVRKAVAEQQWSAWASDRFALSLRLFTPDRRRRDVDNVVKVATDAIFEAIHIDDSAVTRVTAERGGVDPAHPRCEVVVSVIQQEQADGLR